MPAFIIPTYHRPASTLCRLLRSIETRLPDEIEWRAYVIDQNVPPLASLEDARVVVLHGTPGMIGPHYNAGATRAIADGAECLAFMDDDMELADWNAWSDVWRLLQEKETGCVQVVANRAGSQRTRIRLGFKGGGILMRPDAYLAVDGFGEDFLDDVELFLRSHLAGLRNWRTGEIWSYHHYGEAGGLRDLIEEERKGRAHTPLSRLDERYPGIIERCDREWFGFRLTAFRRPAV